MNWPPDYTTVYKERQERLAIMQKDPRLKGYALEYYKDNCAAFIEDWCITYDPRNAERGLPTVMPFVLFDKQREFIDFLLGCIADETGGLVEKSRDMGATWVACCVAVWLWRFREGAAVGWGSRKESLVDKLGDPDSIFEKMRRVIEYLPSFFLPVGYNPKVHSSYMKIINPANGASITGEAGDNIGRGGRKLIYLKDESSHYDRPEKIEAALSENTNTQIDISSVNGTANIFYRRRQAGEVWTPKSTPTKGKTRVFIMDWRDHPAKDQEWYDQKRKKAEEEGLLHIFAQEVDRDYSSAVKGVIIPSKWVKASIDAHKLLGFEGDGISMGALDVGDNGGDKNALSIRKGVILKHVSQWAYAEDPGESARDSVGVCQDMGVNEFQYDCIGIGAGVKVETNRLIREGIIKDTLRVVKWNAAQNPLFPDEHIIPDDSQSPLNKDFFASMKSQGWWQLRGRFKKTYDAVMMLKNDDSTTAAKVMERFDEGDLISISSDIDHRDELINELSQATYGRNNKGKIVVNKQPDGTRSPNAADSVMMNYWPHQEPGFFI